MALQIEDELSQKIHHVRSLLARSRMNGCTESDRLLEDARLALIDIMQDVDVFGIKLEDIGTRRSELQWFLSVIEEQPTKSMVPTLKSILDDF